MASFLLEASLHDGYFHSIPIPRNRPLVERHFLWNPFSLVEVDSLPPSKKSTSLVDAEISESVSLEPRTKYSLSNG